MGKYKYLVSYYIMNNKIKSAFGNSMLTVDKKILKTEEIREMESAISEKIGYKVIILSINYLGVE